MSKAAQILRSAADHIERVGLNQDGGFTSYQDELNHIPATDMRCCAIGAINRVVNGDIGDLTGVGLNDQILATTSLAVHVGEYVPTWNDRKTTTQADVIGALRDTATKLEERP